MHFPGRDLRPYANSVAEDSLVIGSVYFTVFFFDEEMILPEWTTLVYLGKPSDKSVVTDAKWRQVDCDHVFQLASSYFNGVEDVSNPYRYFSTEELAGVYDFEEALDALLRCALRRNASPLSPYRQNEDT